MDALVQLTEVGKMYGAGPTPALDRVSLRLEAGGLTALMGPSGSGKSTLLNLIAGLDRPTSGTIRVAGQALEGMTEASLARFRRARIGLIFQFFNLLDNLSVLDNVLLPADLSDVPRAEALTRARSLLETLNIAETERVHPSRLSGGQRQRVAVARALVNRPALLLADEPTGALDSRSGEGVIDLLRDLARSGQTVVLVTHDERLARSCADRLVTLVDGSLAADNRVSAVLR